MIRRTLIWILIFFINIAAVFSIGPYEKDPSACPTNYQSQDCPGGQFSCNYYSSTLYCGDPATTTANIPGGNANVWNGEYDMAEGGGYIFECLDEGAPNCADWHCQENSTCVSRYRYTTCIGGTTTSECGGCYGNYRECSAEGYGNLDPLSCDINTGTQSNNACNGGSNNYVDSSCTCQCDSNRKSCTGYQTPGAPESDGCTYTEEASCVGVWSYGANTIQTNNANCECQCNAASLDCDGAGDGRDGNGCEITKSTDQSPTYATTKDLYGTTCTGWICDAANGWTDCDGTTPHVGNGCEIQAGETCTSDNGIPGSCNVTDPCSSVEDTGFLVRNPALRCNCEEVPPIPFETGVKAQYNTTGPLLWGRQDGTGPLMNLSNSFNSAFVINNSGCINFYDGTSLCSGESSQGDMNISGNLDVIGNLTIGDTLTFRLGEMIDNIRDGWLRLTGNVNVTQNLSVGDNVLFVDSDNKKVGINNPTPSGGLTVGTGTNDNAQGTNDLYVAGNLEVDGNTYLGDDFQVDNLTVNANFQMQGQMTFNGTLDMENNTIINIGDEGTDFTNTGGLNLKGDLAVNNNNLFVDTTTGKVGIGTNTPNEFLSVQGNVSLDNTFFVDSNQVGINTNNYQAGLTVGTGTANFATGSDDVYIAGDLEVDGSTWLGDDFLVDNLTVTANFDMQGQMTFNGTLDMEGNSIINIGTGNSYFSSTGGLQLTDSLNITGLLNSTGRIYSMGTDILYNISQLTSLEFSDNLTQANLINQLRSDLIANSTFQQMLNNSNYTQAQLINQLRLDLVANSTLQQLLLISNASQAANISKLHTDLSWVNNTLYSDYYNKTNADDRYIDELGDTTGDMTSDLNLDSDTFVISNDDNKVGIGTANPSHKFSSNGTLNITTASTEITTDTNGNVRIHLG